jgi:outer membrane protein
MHPSILRTTFFALLLWVSAAASTQAQAPMSLSDCVLYGMNNNPQIKIAQLQMMDADWRVKENLATGLPQISAGISYNGFIQRGGLPSGALSFGGGGIPDQTAINTLEQKIGSDGVDALGQFLGSLFQSDPDSKLYFSPVHSLNGTIQANQLIFNNSYLIGLRAAKYYKAYTADQLKVAQQTLRNQITDAYLPALLISENLDVLEKNLTTLEKLLSDTKAITKAGFAEQLDVDRLELSITSLRSERDNLVRQREIVVNALKLAMGMPIGNELNLSDNLQKLLADNASVDLTSQVNFMNRPEYVQLLKGRDLSALQIDLYRKPWMPTVAGFVQYQASVQGGFGAKDAATFNDWYTIPSALAGISISLPLYDGGGSKAKKERAILSVQTLESQKALLENAILFEVENARRQYLNAQERVRNQQKNLDLSQRIFDTTQTKFKAGVGSSFEVSQAQTGLYSAQQGLMQAQYDLLIAQTAIKRALGNQ